MALKEERRKFVRLNVLVDVVYNKIAHSQDVELSLTRNIGMGGICLIAYDELKISDLLDIEVYLPEDKNPVHAVGKVVWVKEFIICDIPNGKRFDVGIQFVQITEQDRKRIDKYVFTHFKLGK